MQSSVLCPVLSSLECSTTINQRLAINCQMRHALDQSIEMITTRTAGDQGLELQCLALEVVDRSHVKADLLEGGLARRSEF